MSFGEFGPVVPLTNDSLTSGSTSGTGTFDALMKGFKSHLMQEYEAGRITGAEYTKAYIALTQSAMQSAVQYLLGKDAAYWAAVAGKINADHTLPAQVAMLQEQAEAQRAQTVDTRTDGAPVAGVMGTQADLYAQQIESYKRDSEVKAAKLVADMWTTRFAIAEPEMATEYPDWVMPGNMVSLVETIQAKNDLPYVATPVSP